MKGGVLTFALVCLFAGSALGNVMGIDFGAEFVKIASPHNASIDIVLNEQTRRKSFNYIGFRGSDRYLGEDAKNFAARFPNSMFTMMQKLVGSEYDSQAKANFDELLHTFQLEKNEKRGTVMAQLGNPANQYSTEELVGMLIAYFKQITAEDAKIKPQEAVITVPADWSMTQRQALIDAAALADVRVISLMHSTTATALQYGMQRRGFGNDTVNVVIFDMGSTKTEVGVYRFSPQVLPTNGSKVKLAISLGHLETLHIEVDPNLGGRTFDTCIAKFLEDEIVEKLKIPRIIGGKSLAQNKAQYSLMRAANNAKETLSANTATPVTVEGVAPDKDYSTKVTREQFEEKCSHLFERAVAVAKRAIAAANLTLPEVNSFEMMGGGCRPPKVINELSKFLGRTVDRTLNSDESAAFGAAYHGSRLTSFFRVRSFSVADFFPRNIYFQVVSKEGRSAHRPLFVRSNFGTRKSITMNKTDDFTIELFTSTDGVAFEKLSLVQVSGVREGLETLNFFDPKIVHENNTHIVRVELKLTEAGVIAVEDVEIRYRYAANVTKKVKVNSSTTATTTEISNSTGEDESQGTATTTNETTKEEASTTTAFEIQMKRRSSSLKSTIKFVSSVLMDTDDVSTSKATLSALNKADRIKRETATAKNNLETYIQWVKSEGVLESDEARPLLSAEEREEIEKTVAAVQEWYEDGEGSYDSCTKVQFEEQLSALKNVTSNVTTRLKELEEAKRPKKADKKKKSSKKSGKKGKASASDEEERPTPDPEQPEGAESVPADQGEQTDQEGQEQKEEL